MNVFGRISVEPQQSGSRSIPTEVLLTLSCQFAPGVAIHLASFPGLVRSLLVFFKSLARFPDFTSPTKGKHSYSYLSSSLQRSHDLGGDIVRPSPISSHSFILHRIGIILIAQKVLSAFQLQETVVMPTF